MAYRRKRQPYRRPYSRSYGRTKNARRKGFAKRPKNAFARRVKQVIRQTAETKMVDYFIANKRVTSTQSADFLAYNVLILTADTTAQGMYAISQGTNQAQRVGNKVTTKKAMLKCTLVANPLYDGTANYNPQPMYVTLWIFKLKPHLTDDIATLDSVRLNTFFQNGGTSIGFVGTMVDMQKTVNQNHVTLLKKRVYKLGMSGYVSGAGVNVANNANQQYATNDASYSRMFSMNVTKYLPKHQAFNDGTDITVQRRVWMMFTVCRIDGGEILTSGGFSTGTYPVYSNIGLEYRYTDV